MFDKENLWDLYNCEPLFEFQCPRQWEQLHETADPGVRFCDTCQKSVHFCKTPAEFVRQGELGRCVAVSPTLTIKREVVIDDPYVPLVMGFADVSGFVKEEELRMAFWEEVLKLAPDLPNESATLDDAELQIEEHKQHEKAHIKWMAEQVAKRIAWEAAEPARLERRRKVQEELARIEAMSDREAWDRVGNCPKCGFSHRWDGSHCSHCGHPHRLPD